MKFHGTVADTCPCVLIHFALLTSFIEGKIAFSLIVSEGKTTTGPDMNKNWFAAKRNPIKQEALYIITLFLLGIMIFLK